MRKRSLTSFKLLCKALVISCLIGYGCYIVGKRVEEYQSRFEYREGYIEGFDNGKSWQWQKDQIQIGG